MDKKENPNYYAVLPAAVRYAKITALAKLIYCELTTLTIKEGFAWVSNQYLADIYEVNKSTIYRCLAELKDNGFIKCEYDNDSADNTKRKIYIVDLKQQGGICKNEEAPMQKCIGGICKNEEGAYAKMHNKEIQDEELKINDKRSCYRRLEELLPNANALWISKIDKYADKLPVDLINKAIEETIAVTRNPKYFCAICDEYIAQGYKTLQEVEEAQKHFKAKKKQTKEQDEELKRKSKQAYIDDVKMKKEKALTHTILDRDEYDKWFLQEILKPKSVDKRTKPPD